VRWKTNPSMMALLGAVAMLAACDENTDPPRALAGSDPERGLALIQAKGCAACHAVPGVDWPRGEVGGSLHGFANRPLIAGRLRNQPDTLVAWLRNPPVLAPDTAMPATGLTQGQARDVAAYLYTLDDH
jgi:sulfur-oxidizing protein SoxX